MHNYVSLKQLNPKSTDKLSMDTFSNLHFVWSSPRHVYRLWQVMDRVAHLQAKTSELERRQVSEFDA